MESLEEETDSWVEASRPASSSKLDDVAPTVLVVAVLEVSEKQGINKLIQFFLKRN